MVSVFSLQLKTQIKGTCFAKTRLNLRAGEFLFTCRALNKLFLKKLARFSLLLVNLTLAKSGSSKNVNNAAAKRSAISFAVAAFRRKNL